MVARVFLSTMHGRAARYCVASRANAGICGELQRGRRQPVASALHLLASFFRLRELYYQASDDFRSRAQRPRALITSSRSKSLKPSTEDFPLWCSLIAPARAGFSWHGEIGLRCYSGARLTMRGKVFARVLSWAPGPGPGRGPIRAPMVGASIGPRGLTRCGRLTTKRISSPVPPSHLHLALILAIWTGQRQGDSPALRGRTTTARRYGCNSRRNPCAGGDPGGCAL